MISVEIDKKEGIIFIAEDDSSGCEYEYKTKNDIIEAFKDYIDNYYIQ